MEEYMDQIIKSLDKHTQELNAHEQQIKANKERLDTKIGEQKRVCLAHIDEVFQSKDQEVNRTMPVRFYNDLKAKYNHRISLIQEKVDDITKFMKFAEFNYK